MRDVVYFSGQGHAHALIVLAVSAVLGAWRGDDRVQTTRTRRHGHGGWLNGKECFHETRSPCADPLVACESILGLPGVGRIGVRGPKEFRDVVGIKRRPTPD